MGNTEIQKYRTHLLEVPRTCQGQKGNTGMDQGIQPDNRNSIVRRNSSNVLKFGEMLRYVEANGRKVMTLVDDFFEKVDQSYEVVGKLCKCWNMCMRASCDTGPDCTVDRGGADSGHTQW